MSGWTQEDIDRRNREVLGIGAVLSEVEERLRQGCGEPDVPESLIEAEVTKLLEEDGWRALRTDPVSDRSRGKGFGEVGMADHLYIRYGYPQRMESPGMHWQHQRAEVLWVEFKSAKGKPKKHQLDWHAKERARGALTLIAGIDFPASVEGFMDWYAASGLRRRK